MTTAPLSAPLRILLTNDDGWDAPGITAMYEALSGAGHDVRLVGPARNNSGVSSGIDFAGTLDVRQPTDDPDVYSVSTTPAGTVVFGVEHVFGADRPHLVISGCNAGTNTGFDISFSGTVGAAVVARGFFGIPSIAVSAETDRNEGSAAFKETADLVVRMIAAGLPELRTGAFLNINYPVLDDATPSPKGIRYARTAPQSAAAFGYRQIDETTVEIVPGRSHSTPSAGTDMALLADGFVTVTVLSTDRSVAEADASSMSELLATVCL